MTLVVLGEPDSAWLATLTVLYVEDDEASRELLGKFLRRRVGRLLVASDGAEGLELFKSERPALVVTDIQMPRMDGLSMVEEIRCLDARVPVLVTTAFEQVSYLRRSIDAGVDRYVTKPVDTDKLEVALVGAARGLRAEVLLAAERQHELDRLKAHEWEALGQLAGGMAHDFNNMLQTVLFSLDVAASLAAPDTELYQLLDASLSAAQQAKELGWRLLTLSDRWPARLRAGSVGPTLRAALDRALLGSGTVLRVDLPPELPAVMQDHELLGRAFSALAQNAREAMAGGGVLTVTGALRQLAQGEVLPLTPGRYLELTFRDTGPGMAAEVLPRIFDPYFSTKPRAGPRGTGLGLSLCLAILRKHRGLVIGSSERGDGAVFTVLLPAPSPDELP